MLTPEIVEKHSYYSYIQKANNYAIFKRAVGHKEDPYERRLLLKARLNLNVTSQAACISAASDFVSSMLGDFGEKIEKAFVIRIYPDDDHLFKRVNTMINRNIIPAPEGQHPYFSWQLHDIGVVKIKGLRYIASSPANLELAEYPPYSNPAKDFFEANSFQGLSIKIAELEGGKPILNEPTLAKPIQILEGYQIATIDSMDHRESSKIIDPYDHDMGQIALEYAHLLT